MRSKSNIARSPALLALVGAVCLFLAARSQAEFHIVSHSIEPDSVAQSTKFESTFSEPPDFTQDEFGRAARTFQWYYNPNLGRDLFDDPDSLVFRAPETADLTEIRIRETQGPDEPLSGGWGPIVASVPFEIDGSTVRFTVDWATLGETDSEFEYQLDTFVNGATTDSVPVAAIPLPPAVFAALPVAGAAMLKNVRRRVWVRR